eukprot:scaffold84261_cov75-Phaeocystis_antarctica.AAC.1
MPFPLSQDTKSGEPTSLANAWVARTTPQWNFVPQPMLPLPLPLPSPHGYTSASASGVRNGVAASSP